LLIELAEFHPPNALQNEIGSAVAAPDAGTNEADGADIEEILARLPRGPLRPNERHAHHPAVGESVRQHLTKARFEDMERQERVGEKEDAGQRHDRNGLGQWNTLRHQRGLLSI
jgi:hypothetical protein